MAHVNSFVRIPLLALRQKLSPLPRIGILEEDRIQLRVWPNDIDFNFHLNNSRYLTAMDFGRMHLLASTGMLDAVMGKRWMPLVGSVWITYRRSLPFLAKFTLVNRLICWDERWFYLEQTFIGREGLAAIGLVKALFRDSRAGENIPPQQVIDAVSPGSVSPALPENILIWNSITRDKLQIGEEISS
jgi:acyl-CoA thioesterase FadM